MEIFRFLKIIQRIIIFLVMAAFIPLVVFVFLAHPLNIQSATLKAYSELYDQATTGFAIDIHKNCTILDATLYPHYCFNYCTISIDCQILPSTSSCTILASTQFIVFNHKYCSSYQIKNQIIQPSISSQFITLNYNSNYPPLFIINEQNQPIYFVSTNSFLCLNQFQKIGSDIKVQEIKSQSYVMSMRYIFYSLIPIYAVALVSFIIQSCTRFDVKRLMQVSLFNSSVISLALVIIGVIFDLECSQFQDSIKWVADNCLIESVYSKQLSENLKLDMSNGLNTGFTIVIGLIGVFELFLIAALAILGFVQIKMNQLKKQDYSSGYQLQTL